MTNSKTDFNFNTKGKRLFFILSTSTLILMMAITTALWWAVSPRLHEISVLVAEFSLTALRIFYFILLLGTVLVLLTSYTEKNLLIARFAIRAYIKVLYPATLFFGKLIGITTEKIRESFVHVNNSFVKSIKKKFKPEEILILLPHCLQNYDCEIRLTTDITRCNQCGKCDIKELSKISRKYKIKMVIATGGTLARKIVIENKPKFIIAVACDRDLVDGMLSVFPIPICGILNDRPEGPCINTRVAADNIDLILTSILLKS